VQLRRLLTSIALIAAGFTAACDRGAHPNYTGERAPDFNLADGQTSVRLANYRGKVVLVNFWWTECAPCIEELPSLEQLHHDNPDLAILAISIDNDPDQYSHFLTHRRIDLTTVRDPTQSAAKLFHTDMWPETYVIDRQGLIRRKFVGAQDWSNPEIRAYLKSL
jgi:cytochrome c biogenesis protein CcmG, thiol:disulfide interchange protein DsbE